LDGKASSIGEPEPPDVVGGAIKALDGFALEVSFLWTPMGVCCWGDTWAIM
jgi:hypothetical protein